MRMCSVHNIEMTLRMKPFRHLSCPVNGCGNKRSAKSGPRIGKRALRKMTGNASFDAANVRIFGDNPGGCE